jgi:hypothetical protein
MNAAIGGTTAHRRTLGRGVVLPAACLGLIGLFYAEEDWRGRLAWDQCKHAVASQPIPLNWTNYIPAPVPEEQNIFGVPEMLRWFSHDHGAGWSDFARALPSVTFPGFNFTSNTATMTVAVFTIGRPGMATPDNVTELRWNDPAARIAAADRITAALGPVARPSQSPIGVGLMLRAPNEVQPARFFLRCQSSPSAKELQEFLPDSIVHANPDLAQSVLKWASDGEGTYQVTMPRLAQAADYLAWSDGLIPQFSVIQRALQRPNSQLPGLYNNPNTVPGVNFLCVRNFAQTLGTRAQCHLLLGEPAAALGELTLLDDFCRRVLAESHPATLLSAMVNQAVRGLYAEQVGEGLRLHAWREPQLIALQEQLKAMDVLGPVKEAFTLEAVITHRALASVPSAGMVKQTTLARFYPSGWGYQRMTARLRLEFARLTSIDMADHAILAPEVDAATKQAQALDHGAFGFVASLGQADFKRACQNTAQSQTKINEALIACALERFYMTHHDYPETLNALAPQFLDAIPRDVIGGQFLHYRRAAGPAFVLYSVGWNGRDDGGVRGHPLPGTDGDWVWSD